MRRRKWGSLVLMIPLLVLFTVGTSHGALVRLYTDDFPCETVPPKCPSVINLVVEFLKDLPGDEIRLGDIPRFDIDIGICSELYVEAGAELVIPATDENVNAEWFMDGDPASEWNDHLAIRMQIGDITMAGGAKLVGKNCLGFIDFTLPLVGGFYIETLLMEGRYRVYHDTVANKVVLQEGYTGVAIGGIELTGLPDWLLEFADPIAILIANGLVAPLINGALMKPNGIVFNLAQSIMTGLYGVVPCGGCMIPPNAAGMARTAYFVPTLLLFLLPAGLVAYLKRRNRK